MDDNGGCSFDTVEKEGCVSYEMFTIIGDALSLLRYLRKWEDIRDEGRGRIYLLLGYGGNEVEEIGNRDGNIDRISDLHCGRGMFCDIMFHSISHLVSDSVNDIFGDRSNSSIALRDCIGHGLCGSNLDSLGACNGLGMCHGNALGLCCSNLIGLRWPLGCLDDGRSLGRAGQLRNDAITCGLEIRVALLRETAI